MSKKRKIKKESKIKLEDLYSKIAITGSIFLGLFVLVIVAGDYTTGAVYRGYGSSFYGGDVIDILEIYYQYPSFFDLAIFLTIFLGLGQSILGKHLEEGGKAVYVGLGVFLAVALLIWERQTGYSLLENFGPWAFFLIIILLSVFVYTFLDKTTGSGLIAFGIAYIVFYVAFFGLIEDYTAGFGFLLFNPNIPIDLRPWMDLALLASFGLLVWGVIRKASG